MDRTSLIIGLLAGFVIGIVVTGAVIELFVIEILNSIPPDLITNMNVTVAINETRWIETLNTTRPAET